MKKESKKYLQKATITKYKNFEKLNQFDGTQDQTKRSQVVPRQMANLRTSCQGLSWIIMYCKFTFGLKISMKLDIYWTVAAAMLRRVKRLEEREDISILIRSRFTFGKSFKKEQVARDARINHNANVPIRKEIFLLNWHLTSASPWLTELVNNAATVLSQLLCIQLY